MGRGDSEIRLGTPSRQRVIGQSGNSAGADRTNSKDTPENSKTVALEAHTPAGYTLDADRLRAPDSTGQQRIHAARPKARPAIIIATGLSVVFLFFVIWLNSSSASTDSDLNYENTVILSEYAAFLQKHADPPLPLVEEIRDELNRITYLQNTGRKEEARFELQKLVLEAKDDKENPIYKFAVKHLQ